MLDLRESKRGVPNLGQHNNMYQKNDPYIYRCIYLWILSNITTCFIGLLSRLVVWSLYLAPWMDILTQTFIHGQLANSLWMPRSCFTTTKKGLLNTMYTYLLCIYMNMFYIQSSIGCLYDEHIISGFSMSSIVQMQLGIPNFKGGGTTREGPARRGVLRFSGEWQPQILFWTWKLCSFEQDKTPCWIMLNHSLLFEETHLEHLRKTVKGKFVDPQKRSEYQKTFHYAWLRNRVFRNGFFETGYHDAYTKGCLTSQMLVCVTQLNPIRWVVWPKITILHRSDKPKDSGVSGMKGLNGSSHRQKNACMKWIQYGVTVLHQFLYVRKENEWYKNPAAMFRQFPETPRGSNPKAIRRSWRPVLLKICCALPTSEVWLHLRRDFLGKVGFSDLLCIEKNLKDFFTSQWRSMVWWCMICCACIHLQIYTYIFMSTVCRFVSRPNARASAKFILHIVNYSTEGSSLPKL